MRKVYHILLWMWNYGIIIIFQMDAVKYTEVNLDSIFSKWAKTCMAKKVNLTTDLTSRRSNFKTADQSLHLHYSHKVHQLPRLFLKTPSEMTPHVCRSTESGVSDRRHPMHKLICTRL